MSQTETKTLQSCGIATAVIPKKGPTLFQGSTGHGHNPAHIGPHGHNLAVQAQGPAVVQGHVHPPAVQGQQQFQRLKVRLHGNLQNSRAHCELHNMLISLSLYKSPYFFFLLNVFFCNTDNTRERRHFEQNKVAKNKLGFHELKSYPDFSG